MDVKTGDTVLFGKYSGQDIKFDGVDYLIMKEDDVLAIDASQNMAARIRARANESGFASDARRGQVRAACMDGTALAVTDASFDAALSVFGIVLFPDAALGMREIARALRPGGRLAIVTWTEIEKYELSARLLAAIAQAFASENVSIQTVRQTGRAGEAELIVVTHSATEAALASTVKRLAAMDMVRAVESVIRVEGAAQI